MRIDAETRRIDPRVKQVMASLAAVHEVVLIASSDGTLAADVRPLVRVNVSVIVEQNGRREQGYSGGGGRFGLDELLRGDEPFAHGREAVRQALVNLEAVAAPAGSMTVVLGPGWPGILLHEAIGHGLEGRLQPQGHLGVLQPHRPEGRRGRDHGGRRRHARPAARLAERRRRGHADAVHGADRERHSARLSCRTS